MWRFASARAIGTSHLKTNLPCQDQIACEVLPRGVVAAAVADGAGSAARAEQGAEIAVDTVIMHIKRSIEKNRSDFSTLLWEAAVAARDAIMAKAREEEFEPKDYASTLMAVVLSPDGGGALQIGDGVIVVSEGQREWSWVFWPQRGEYANTTYFLTDEDALERIKIESLPHIITDIALMSDGLEPLALHYASMTVHNPFFNGMFHALHISGGSAEVSTISTSLEQFLSSERVRSRVDDDLSLILVTRHNHEGSQ